MDTRKIIVVSTKDTRNFIRRIRRLMTKYRADIRTAENLEAVISDDDRDTGAVLILTAEAIDEHQGSIFRLLREVVRKSPKTQVLIFAHEDQITVAVEALKAGAYQYVKLPVRDDELKLIIETAIEQRPEIVGGQRIEHQGKSRFGELIGGSLPMLQVYNQITQAAHTDIPVLILGETGTGKDLVSYTIHKMSARSDEPYLAVNLGALPPELLASELFGHEKGAFTGAVRRHKGVFEQGHRGTVFLDEIDTIDEKVQVSLLRLLEQKKFKRLGGMTSVRSMARLIAATNENIDDLVESGVFRTDLFYRLDVFRIILPALRDRKADIPLLVEEMILKYSKTYKKHITSVSQESMDALMQFDWPGNVRELKNAIQRAVLVCNEDQIRVTHLPPRFQATAGNKPSISFTLGTTLDEVEGEMVAYALAATNNNRKEAAKLLGISRRAIYNKLNKHNL